MQLFQCENCTVRLDSIFQDLKSEDMALLESIKQCKFFDKGEYLFLEGEDPRGIYCLRSGKVIVSKIGEDGREQITHLVHAGQTLGHRALFAEEKYSGSAMAMDRSHLCYIPKQALEKLVSQNPSVIWAVAKLLSIELREAESRLTNMALDNVRTRLIDALRTLINTYGLKSDGATINSEIKRQVLADIAGTSRESISRNLTLLQNENIILISGKKIVILDHKVFQ